MADINYDDISDAEDQDGTGSLDRDDTKQDVCKNLLEDFAAPTSKLMRQSVSHRREHMQVHLRIRPFTNREMEQGEAQDCMEITQPSTLLMRAPKDSFTFKSSQRGFSSLTHKFTFSRIFGEVTSQKEFFDETMLGTVKDFIDGQNCLVFTYGVTNAGKTYTIQGVPQDGGILPRSLDVVFNSLEGRLYSSILLKPRFFCDVTKLDEGQRKKEEYIKESVLAMADRHSNKQDGSQESSAMDDTDDSKASNYTTATEDSQSEISLQSILDDVSVHNVLEDINSRIPDDTSVDVEAQGPLKFSVWVSFAEIYNEYIYDLLEAFPKGKKVRRQPLKLSEDKTGQIYIKGLKEISVQSADEAYKILKIGQQNRSMAATKLNQCSSRSHCIFSVKILRVVDVENPHVARVSQLSFCDLAGSERYTRTRNTGDRLKEAGNINTSLLTLGKCIHTLRYNQNHPKSQPKIIPFRESKLTRLFQTFFLGKGKASMIVNVNQCASGFDESIQVLKFSAIAKQVTTVTSKLDNKWKVPSMTGPAVPKLASSRALSLALRQSLSRSRASVAWATPGPQPDTNLDLTTVDESYIEEEDEEEEEEDEEEEDEEEEDEEEEDEEEDEYEDEEGQRTPRESILNGESRGKLVGLVEALKMQLIEERKRTMMMEMQIREEVCQEMAQQLVEIEDEYKDLLQKERHTTEEMYEKRLEMYEKSVKDTRKRPCPDNDTDDEHVSSLLLHAEQAKVQHQEKTIKGLHMDIKTLKEALEESQDKMDSQDQMLTELQGLAETSSQALVQANSKLCARDQRILEMTAALQETQDAGALNDEELNQRVYSLTEKVTVTEEALKVAENTRTEFQKKVAQLQSEFIILQESLQSFQVESKTDKNLSAKLADAVSEAAALRHRLLSSSKEHSDSVSALGANIDELQKRLNKAEVVIQDLQVNLKETESKIEGEKQKCFEAEEKVLGLEETLTPLREKNDEMEDVLADLQSRFDQTNTKGQEATVQVASLENKIEYLKEGISVEQKAHTDTKKLASEYGCQVSLLRSQLEMAERTAMASGDYTKRNKELEGSLKEMQQALTDKEIVLAEASKWKGSSTDLRLQLKTLEDKLKDTENKRSTADEMVQKLSYRFTSLQQSLAQKEQELSKSISNQEKDNTKAAEAQTVIQQLKDKQASGEEKLRTLEKGLEEQKAKTKSKADTIKSLMSKVEMQCLKHQAVEKDSVANKEMIAGLKTALQEQEATMASQDEILASKEQELEENAKELEDLQNKYSDLLKSSSESKQEVRAANKNHERWISEKECMKKEQIEKELRLCKVEEDREDLKTQLSESVAALTDSNIQVHNRQKKVTALEQEIMKQVASKEETLSKWREERDVLVKALEKKMTSLLETQRKNEAALAEKDDHIKHLKNKMVESISDSQAVTDDDSDTEEMTKNKTRGGSSEDNQREVQQLRKQLEKERCDKTKASASSERHLATKNHAILELEDANRHLQQQLGLIEVSVDVKRLSSGSSNSCPTQHSAQSPSHQPSHQLLSESPDLYIVDVKDQESFHQPGRCQTRVQMDVTPLQKKLPVRKTRANTRKAKKRKSTELLEEIDIESFGKCSRPEESSSVRSARSSSRRNANKANRGDTDRDNENMLVEVPSTSGRSKRAALSKIGDLFQNTPLAKSAASIKSSSRSQHSAKKLMESAAAHLTSPTKSPDVEIVAYHPPLTTEKKRKRRLLKTDISVPFESSPFEVVNVGESSKADNSHSIVTRKLRSRNTRV